jgi:hypothetical protein
MNTGPDWRGLTSEAKGHRRNMLECHAADLKQRMVESGLGNPVGLTSDVTEGKGRLPGRCVLMARKR